MTSAVARQDGAAPPSTRIAPAASDVSRTSEEREEGVPLATNHGRRKWEGCRPFPGDRRIALAAIDNRLRAAKSSWRKKCSRPSKTGGGESGKLSLDDGGGDGSDGVSDADTAAAPVGDAGVRDALSSHPDDDGGGHLAVAAAAEAAAAEEATAEENFVLHCLDETAASLKCQIEAETSPNDVGGRDEGGEVGESDPDVRGAGDNDAALIAAFGEFNLLRRSCSPSALKGEGDGNDDDDDESSLSSVDAATSITDEDEDDEEFEFEEEELHDDEAQIRVRLVREQAREISARVIAIREEALGRALEVTRRNISEVLRANGFSSVEEEEGGSGGTEGFDEGECEEAFGRALQTGINGGDGDGGGDGLADPMRDALRRTSSSLRCIDAGMSEKIDSLRETLEVIDAAIDKNRRLKNGEPGILSQTEEALFSQSNEGAVRSFPGDGGGGTDAGEEGDCEATADPEEIFALFMAGGL